MTDSSHAQHAVGSGAAHPVGMQLNQFPADQTGSAGPSGLGGGQKDLVSSPAQNRAAAQTIEKHIEPDTKKAGAWADNDTSTAVKAFQPKDGDGWLTSAALKSAHETWGHQVGTLMNRLSYEKAALRGNATLQHGTDVGVGSGVRGISVLDRL